MDRKTEAQLRQELADVWALLDAERAGRAAAVAAERERCAKLCEAPVQTLSLPNEPLYEGDVRHVERRVALALAAAIRA